MLMVNTVTQEKARSPSSSNSTTRQPVWKTVLKVVLIVALVAAAIYAGSIVVPKVVQWIGAAAGGVASVVSAVTNTTETVTKTATDAVNAVNNTIQWTDKIVNAADKLLNKPLGPVILDKVVTTVDKVSEAESSAIKIVTKAMPERSVPQSSVSPFSALKFLISNPIQSTIGIGNIVRNIKPKED